MAQSHSQSQSEVVLRDNGLEGEAHSAHHLIVSIPNYQQLVEAAREQSAWDSSGAALAAAIKYIENAPARAVEEANRGWPFEGLPEKQVTQAPFAYNQYNFMRGQAFKLRKIKQKCPLFVQRKCPEEITGQILAYLCENHSGISKFAATCQAAFDLVSFGINLYDSATAYYGSCDKDPEQYQPCRRFDGCSQSTMVKGICGFCRKRSYKYKELQCSGPITVVARFRERVVTRQSFPLQLDSVQRMTMAFENYPANFEILHLHKTDFLTMNVLKLVVPTLWRLKSLGIYACPLIHIGHTNQILDLIAEPEEGLRRRKTTFDFFPCFQYGPKLPAQTNHVSRDYGACYETFCPPGWESTGSLNIRIACLALVYSAIQKSKNFGFDLVSKDSALYLWLGRLGVEDLEGTIDALKNTTNLTKLSAWVDPQNYYEGSFRKSGDFIWQLTYKCPGCKEDVPGIFYDAQELFITTALDEAPVNCLGCLFKRHLAGERDHWKCAINKITATWLSGVEEQISRAVEQAAIDSGMDAAIHHDIYRVQHENRRKRLGKELYPQRGYPAWPHFKFSQQIHEKAHNPTKW